MRHRATQSAFGRARAVMYAEQTMHRWLESTRGALSAAYQALDDWRGDTDNWERYGTYFAVTVVAITVAANLLRPALRRLVLAVLPDAATLSFAREHRAEAAASALLPNASLARSLVAHDDGRTSASTDDDRRRRRQWLTARRLQAPLKERALLGWARRDYAQQRALELVSRATSAFGATNIVRLAMFLRPATLVVSAAMVLWARPLAVASSVEGLLRTVWDEVNQVRPTRLLPLLLLVVGLATVSRRVPLIDRIRARDEAAKDANRLLAELYGRLSGLLTALEEWRNALLTHRHELVRRYVEDSTGHAWT